MPIPLGHILADVKLHFESSWRISLMLSFEFESKFSCVLLRFTNTHDWWFDLNWMTDCMTAEAFFEEYAYLVFYFNLCLISFKPFLVLLRNFWSYHQIKKDHKPLFWKYSPISFFQFGPIWNLFCSFGFFRAFLGSWFRLRTY